MSHDAIDVTLASIKPDRHVHYQNYQVAAAVRACCGFITPNMVAVSLRCVNEEVHLYFYRETESSQDRDEIREAASDLEALQLARVPIAAHVKVVGARIATSQIEGFAIYRRYEPHFSGQ
jgi:hypothetical protein